VFAVNSWKMHTLLIKNPPFHLFRANVLSSGAKKRGSLSLQTELECVICKSGAVRRWRGRRRRGAYDPATGQFLTCLTSGIFVVSGVNFFQQAKVSTKEAKQQKGICSRKRTLRRIDLINKVFWSTQLLFL